MKKYSSPLVSEITLNINAPISACVPEKLVQETGVDECEIVLGGGNVGCWPTEGLSTAGTGSCVYEPMNS